MPIRKKNGKKKRTPTSKPLDGKPAKSTRTTKKPRSGISAVSKKEGPIVAVPKTRKSRITASKKRKPAGKSAKKGKPKVKQISGVKRAASFTLTKETIWIAPGEKPIKSKLFSGALSEPNRRNTFLSIVSLLVGTALAIPVLSFNQQYLAQNQQQRHSSGVETTIAWDEPVKTSPPLNERVAVWNGFLLGTVLEPGKIHLKKSLYDGIWIPIETEEIPVAVMVENYIDARPLHSGLADASIVYETLAEGGITRFMAIYPRQITQRVGPTRSARHYFVDWATEYQPTYVHAGGSPTANHYLWQYSDLLLSLDEDENPNNGAYTFRDHRQSAPHNLFTNLEQVRLEAQRREKPSPPYSPHFCFSEQVSAQEQRTLIELDFPGSGDSNYFVTFRYDPDTQTYKRFHRKQNEVPHIDTLSKTQIAPTNLVVQVTPSWPILNDPKERIDMVTRGREKAYFFSHGYYWQGTWEKSSDEESSGIPRTIFRNASGVEQCLSPGQTWIAVISDEILMETSPTSTPVNTVQLQSNR